MAAIKWDLSYLVLPGGYSSWGAESKREFNKAINMIDDDSPAGRVLRGLKAGERIQFSNPVLHTGTDDNGLDHISFRRVGILAPYGEHHLYPDGTYTTPGPPASRQTFDGNPDGDPVVDVPEEEDSDTEDFPVLSRERLEEHKKKAKK